MIEALDKELYWKIVQDCLREIFGLPGAEATARSQDLRKKIQGKSTKNLQELFYHAEPIDVAADLACTRKELKKADWKKYSAILARHQW